MGNAPDDEQGRADDLAAAKAARMRSVDPERAARRLYGLLARRGYSSDVARSAVRSALAVEAPDDEHT
jgi:regulatory protein